MHDILSTDESTLVQTQPWRASRWRGRLLWLAVALVLLAPVVYTLRPLSPYERYVSPPMDPHGTRLEFLIPRGWELTDFTPPGTSSSMLTWLTLKSPEPLSWLPKWARRWL